MIDVDWNRPKLKEQTELLDALRISSITNDVRLYVERTRDFPDHPWTVAGLEAFLQHYSILPVPPEDLKENDANECIFCVIPFGEESDGQVEYSVRTPCNHVFGCIVSKLSLV